MLLTKIRGVPHAEDRKPREIQTCLSQHSAPGRGGGCSSREPSSPLLLHPESDRPAARYANRLSILDAHRRRSSPFWPEPRQAYCALGLQSVQLVVAMTRLVPIFMTGAAVDDCLAVAVRNAAMMSARRGRIPRTRIVSPILTAASKSAAMWGRVHTSKVVCLGPARSTPSISPCRS